MVDLLDWGVLNFDTMITGLYNLDQWEDAFEDMCSERDAKAFIHLKRTGRE
jgi:Zn-dependent alcohol dehydrogenase